jgi:hypothetical protein
MGHFIRGYHCIVRTSSREEGNQPKAYSVVCLWVRKLKTNVPTDRDDRSWLEKSWSNNIKREIKGQFFENFAQISKDPQFNIKMMFQFVD